jgi:phospholipase/lecithinase/hemolysin
MHMTRQLRFASLALVLFAAFGAATAVHADQGTTRLVIFGDSLSDPGNFYAAFALSSQAPYEMVPSAPYTIGGHHWTNGPTWAEQLAGMLGSPNSGRPALLQPGVFGNYAVGGARARANAPDFPYFDLTTQVSSYLAVAGGRADPRAVYVVWLGGNDLRDALAAAGTDPTFQTSAGILREAVESTAANIVALWSAGARVFLVPGVPDLSRAPAVRALGPAAVGGAWQLSVLYNDAESGALDQLVAALPGIRIIRLDTFALLDSASSNPGAYGLADGTTPCLRFYVVAHAICEEPEEMLFWDGIHPTTAGHHLVAAAARAALRANGTAPR